MTGLDSMASGGIRQLSRPVRSTGTPTPEPTDRRARASVQAAADRRGAPRTAQMISMICLAVMPGNSTEAVSTTDSATSSATTVAANMVVCGR